MIEVKCHRCDKKYVVDRWHYVANNRNRKGNFYCSTECRTGSIESRFWKYVDKKSKDECWNWVGNKDSKGYGRLSSKGKYLSAHRLSYSLNISSNYDNTLYVCHKCDNPSCVNPNHLFLGTAKDNAIDCRSKGRDSFTRMNNDYKKAIILLNRLVDENLLNSDSKLLEDVKLFLDSSLHLSITKY